MLESLLSSGVNLYFPLLLCTFIYPKPKAQLLKVQIKVPSLVESYLECLGFVTRDFGSFPPGGGWSRQVRPTAGSMAPATVPLSPTQEHFSWAASAELEGVWGQSLRAAAVWR